MSAAPLDAVDEDDKMQEASYDMFDVVDEDDKMQEASYDSYDSIIHSSTASISQSQSLESRLVSGTNVPEHPSSWKPQTSLEDSTLSMNTTTTMGKYIFVCINYYTYSFIHSCIHAYLLSSHGDDATLFFQVFLLLPRRKERYRL